MYWAVQCKVLFHTSNWQTFSRNAFYWRHINESQLRTYFPQHLGRAVWAKNEKEVVHFTGPFLAAKNKQTRERGTAGWVMRDKLWWLLSSQFLWSQISEVKKNSSDHRPATIIPTYWSPTWTNPHPHLFTLSQCNFFTLVFSVVGYCRVWAFLTYLQM